MIRLDESNLPAAVRDCEPLVKQVAALFEAVQRRVGPAGSFRLSGNKIAYLFGIQDGMDVWMAIRVLVRLGLVEVVNRGDNKKTFQAAEYRWIMAERPDRCCVEDQSSWRQQFQRMFPASRRAWKRQETRP